MNVRSAVVVLVAALPASAMGQQETGADVPSTKIEENRTTPRMNGHVFAPSFLVETPFRTTTLKLGLLYGFGKATADNYDSNGNVVGKSEFTFANFAQTLRFEYQLLEWLSAGALVITNLYGGIDGPSVVSIGANVVAGAGLRVKVGTRLGPVQTGAILEVSNAPEYQVLVGAALLKAIREHIIDPDAGLQSVHTRTVSAIAGVSWAPWSALGLTGNVGYLHKQLRLSADAVVQDQDGVIFAALADFDFGKISPVPIGLLGAYKLTAPIGSDGVERIDDVSGGISYTARPELGLGIEFGWRAFTIRPPLDSKGPLVQLGLQYYW